VRPGLVVDSSGLLAVLLAEAERERALEEIFGSETRLLSAFSYLETSIVVTSRKGAAGRALLDALLRDAAFRVVDLAHDQAEIAHDAWTDFGKGNHPAGLNIGDCCAYALAKSAGYPLLYKGDDFGRTDLEGVSLTPSPR
jgi:ribonuclease VapC